MTIQKITGDLNEEFELHDYEDAYLQYIQDLDLEIVKLVLPSLDLEMDIWESNINSTANQEHFQNKLRMHISVTIRILQKLKKILK